MVNVIPRTKNVGDSLLVAVQFRNTSNQDFTFPIGISIGKENIAWHDVDIYTDGLGEFDEEFVAAGNTGIGERQMTVPEDMALLGPPGTYDWDVWVTIRDPDNPDVILEDASFVAVGALTVIWDGGSQGASGEILDIILT